MAHSKTREKILVNTEAQLGSSQPIAQKFLGYWGPNQGGGGITVTVQASHIRSSTHFSLQLICIHQAQR